MRRSVYPILILCLLAMTGLQPVKKVRTIPKSDKQIKESRFPEENPKVQQNTLLNKSSFIGLRYGPELPEGLIEKAGALIDGPNGSELALEHIVKGNEEMIWVEKLTGRDNYGKPYWEVLDVLMLPRIKANQALIFGVLGCMYNKRYDPKTIVIADEQKRGPYYKKNRYAWRLNPNTNKLEPVSIRKIRCEYSSCE